jgi:hypothetical protein
LAWPSHSCTLACRLGDELRGMLANHALEITPLIRAGSAWRE